MHIAAVPPVQADVSHAVVRPWHNPECPGRRPRHWPLKTSGVYFGCLLRLFWQRRGPVSQLVWDAIPLGTAGISPLLFGFVTGITTNELATLAFADHSPQPVYAALANLAFHEENDTSPPAGMTFVFNSRTDPNAMLTSGWSGQNPGELGRTGRPQSLPFLVLYWARSSFPYTRCRSLPRSQPWARHAERKGHSQWRCNRHLAAPA